MNVRGWTVLAVLAFVFGLSACQQGAEEGTGEPGAQPTQESTQQPTQEYGGEQ